MTTTEKTLRVLVVDDDRDGADTLGMVFEELGNEVHVMYGGAQALEDANTFRPDLMLIDLVMPHVDGYGLVVRLRQNPAFAQTRFVAITGHVDEEHKSSAMKAGFNMVHFKPITQRAIAEVLASVVREVAPADQLPRLPERASLREEWRLPIGESANHGSAVLKKPIVLVADDEKALGTMLDSTLRHYGFVVWLATSGKEAVELYREHCQSIALVLLDVQMPGMDGPATLAAIRAINPEVQCCFMSGHTGKYSASELLDMGAVHVIPKPFASFSLLARLLGDMVDPGQ